MPSDRTIMNYLNKACALCVLSDVPKARLGAILVCNSKIVATGFNQYKTSPVQKKYNRFRNPGEVFPSHIHNDTLHAEIDCLNKASFIDLDYKKCILYVSRIDKANHPKMAKPCPACHQALVDIGIKKIYYTTEDGYGCLLL